MNATSSHKPRWGRVRLGEILVAAGLVGLSVFLAVGAMRMPVVASYARVGPQLFPYLVASGTGLLGLILLAQALRGGWKGVDEDRRFDAKALGTVAAGLVLNLLLMQRAGFVIASVVLFVLVAAAFGSRRRIRDLLIGTALAIVVYLGFTRLLGLRLPAGLLPF